MITIYCKIHSQQNHTILAAADQELIGKILVQGEIEFKVNPSFYKGNIVDETELARQIEDADSANLIGKKVVKVAIQNGFIKKEDTITIDEHPHAIIIKV